MKQTTDNRNISGLTGAGLGWKTLCGVWGLFCAGISPALAQEGGKADVPAYVHIHTNFPEALVFADGMLVGGASRMPLAVPAGSRSLRLAAPGPGDWSVAPIARPLDAVRGDTVHVTMHFPYHYRIESEPFGAGVFVEQFGERLSVGETPLLHRSETPLEGSILVQRRGYVPQSVQPGKAVWNRHVVHLKPINPRDSSEGSRYSNPPRASRAWIDYMALGTALAAGAAAVRYKFKADNLAEKYERTRDPALTSRIEAHDFRAAAAFGVMQGGLGVFAIRLALR